MDQAKHVAKYQSVREVLVLLLYAIVDTRHYDLHWVVLQVGTGVEIFRVTTVQKRYI